MRKLIAGIVLCLLIVTSAFAEEDYAVSKIPLSLLVNADVVKRLETTSFEVVNTGEAILKRTYALTILNENGDRQAAFLEYYDKMRDIRDVEGALYDANGKQLKKLKSKDILDLSGVDGSSLMDDLRKKFHHFYHKVYPYTVEYTVELKYKGTLFFPTWLPRDEERLSVQQSMISIIYPASYTVRYRALNYTSDPVATSEKDKKVLSWKVKELPAVQSEFASPSWLDWNTVVFFGPTDFEVENYKGNMNSWEEFGKFVYSLKQGKDQLPDNVKAAVAKLIAGKPDTRSKVAALYEYLQKNTRYVSIQLGIGGWQPFDARFVASKAYGDCKALSNYMYSLLKEAGISSYYALIRAGGYADRVTPDFPSQQFNHVILCVPEQTDTIWLECTSQTMPPGYLGSFTANRYALLIDEKGGHLVHTPKYGIRENSQIRAVRAKLDKTGFLDMKAVTRYGGLQQDDIHGLINNLSKDKVKEYLQEQLDFPTYDINRFEYKEEKTAMPVIDETLDIAVSNYATITGKRLFIVPNVMTRSGRKLTPSPDRTMDVVIRTEYTDIDTVEIELPEGYRQEALPADVLINSQFGKYKSSVKFSGNKLLYYRYIEHYSGRFPAKDYGDLVKFYESIYKADRTKVVLVKNEEQQPLKAF